MKHTTEQDRRAALANVINQLRGLQQAMKEDGYVCRLLPIFEEDLMRSKSLSSSTMLSFLLSSDKQVSLEVVEWTLAAERCMQVLARSSTISTAKSCRSTTWSTAWPTCLGPSPATPRLTNSCDRSSKEPCSLCPPAIHLGGAAALFSSWQPS